MSSSIIPNQYFFDFSFKSSKRKFPTNIDGNIDKWDPKNRVPDLMHTRISKPFANVYLSWDSSNLYIAFRVFGKRVPVDVDTNRFWQKDCMELWLNLRNDKPVQRYNEHCHHFFLLPLGKKGDRDRATAGECREPGSVLQENIYDHPQIEIASIISAGGYSLEARIPIDAIPTYDPANFPLIGFNYHINDTDRRAQWWSCGPDFSRHTDPSTWGTAELVD